ncbi:sugar/pyridoxal phosphate phosphatase YigL [Blochmannia endosymbiont of Camponotus (Colobopsis) obliquus]|uniref:sugar/pyridoxal phosphate phosphatase YigL n=1 Tax=Blochmannia endosymbiont of Camponotus (Colobopsis) obliquus TaxID=1505597 RepID=UPI00061A5E4F|nr:sugar/pyridoxal phosphate phosphatase YigL [Blochmannia endosymbiont of Camponotus (Colobopsis) obliquus]AKC60722.1 Pyridoxal phosphate phosphatase YigL [Blochmannia endosymbiont of Camponotus (Colobopsis) obliquus]
MFCIVASDLDGTLLSSNHQVSVFTKQILRSLINRGIHFIFATGRHYINVVQICDDLDIHAYMITSNGARVYDMNGSLICAHDLNENIALELFDIVYRDPKITTNIFRNDEWFINRNVFNQGDFFNGKFVLNAQFYQQGMLSAKGVCKVYFTSDNYQYLLNLEQYLNKRWGGLINVSFSLPVCLEVMAGGVSKGYALGEVANLLGYELRHCISFGDGMNDREMLEMSGKGCIMRNAQQRLKDSLPFLEVIGSNEEDAVSNYLKTMYLMNECIE